MKATETKILKFIGGEDKAFIIPPFQRNYEWTKEQCEELFFDIINACKTDTTHYLGNVVYYSGENNGASFTEIILVDGQQRVTTILLLLCSIRDYSDDKKLSRKINRKYLINEDDDYGHRIILKQTEYDSGDFEKIVNNEKVTNDSNIAKNYNLFLNLIKEEDIKLEDIYESINKLEIVDIDLQISNNLDKVQKVFEKINSTGKRLEEGDLIRNYLLLANNSKEQEERYKKYWLKIENEISSKNISRFSKDYLVMKTLKHISEKEVYKNFKKYKQENELSEVEILDDMCKYTKYYAFLKGNNFVNKEINKHIKVLNFIKSDDVYPLYLYLFYNLYESDKKELSNILMLISDFLIRYRVVAVSGGGGTLRQIVINLLENLKNSEIEITFDDIRTELSNSNTLAGRFPNDEEFKEAIKKSVNKNYAKVILYKIEDYETKNVLVSLEDITVEHLMPQKLTTGWKKDLGEENYSEIYTEYLENIGNLALLSQGYNSKLSNKNWSVKKQDFKDVQFKMTSELYKYKKWTKEEIENRAETIATKACKAITKPENRTRNIRVIAESGVYSASDIETDMKGSKPEYLEYRGNKIDIKSWKDYLLETCKLVYSIDSKKFAMIVENNMVHKNTSVKNGVDKDPIITTDKRLLTREEKLKGTGYFVENNLSSNQIRGYVKRVLDIYGICDDVRISIK